MEETIEKSDDISLKDKLQSRIEQLEVAKKQLEAQYIETCGAVTELKRTIALIQ